MVKVNKYAIAIILAGMASSVVAEEPPKKFEYSNMASLTEMKAWYSGQCESVIRDIEAIGQPEILPESFFQNIKEAGCLRVQNGIKSLSPYLAVNSRYRIFPMDYMVEPLTSPLFLSINNPGDIARHHPVFGALLRIGIPFDAAEKIIRKEKVLSLYSLILAYYSGGYYFMSKQGEHAGKDLYNAISLFSKLSENGVLPYSIYAFDQFDSEIIKEYDTMQATLITRFAEERATLSMSLPDTIATMGFIRSLDAIPVLSENLTICPQVSTNAPGGYVFPAAEALIEIGPAIGYCFGQLEKTKPLSVEESLWLRISHELYPESLEYGLERRAATNDTRAARLLGALPWRRLDENYEIIGKGGQP